MRPSLISFAALFFCGFYANCTNTGEGKENTLQNMADVKAIPSDYSADSARHTATAYFAGGCFWGTQYYFEKAKGVIDTKVGYMGGHTQHPTYEQVCSHTTGHYETIKVVYDTRQTDYEKLARLFFDIHDPTQSDGQGPDIGQQYMSVLFYSDSSQRQIGEKLIAILETKGYKIATRLLPVTTFWEAEEYHEHHYDREGTTPYCHKFIDRFN